MTIPMKKRMQYNGNGRGILVLKLKPNQPIDQPPIVLQNKIILPN